MSYPWYSLLPDEDYTLQQGDLIPNCPILLPPPRIDDGDAVVEFNEINSIILSQSCDLENNKIQIALVCPFSTLSEFFEGLPDPKPNKKEREKIASNIAKGHINGYHLLDSDVRFDLTRELIIVDFRSVYGIHIDSLSSVVSRMQREYFKKCVNE